MSISFTHFFLAYFLELFFKFGRFNNLFFFSFYNGLLLPLVCDPERSFCVRLVLLSGLDWIGRMSGHDNFKFLIVCLYECVPLADLLEEVPSRAMNK